MSPERFPARRLPQGVRQKARELTPRGGFMSAVVTQQAADTGVSAAKPMEIRVYSHSMLFYWWPVWAVGYLFALLTWMRGVEVTFEYKTVLIHPSHNLGAIYTIVFLIVMLMT